MTDPFLVPDTSALFTVPEFEIAGWAYVAGTLCGSGDDLAPGYFVCIGGQAGRPHSGPLESLDEAKALRDRLNLESALAGLIGGRTSRSDRDQPIRLTGWRAEFPDYPPETMPEIPASWSDISWHNDAMPSFMITDSLAVWVDYLDPAMSDFGEDRGSRFTLVPMEDGQHIDVIELPYLETDDWNEVLAMAETLTR